MTNHTEPFRFKKVEYIASAGAGGGFPEGGIYPEIAVVGRSNVGKSTLINALCRRNIARTSKTPGKTRRIHYFLINDGFYFVDLPGYGYAKVSQAQHDEWERELSAYLSGGRVKHVLLLLDSRHEPTKLDKRMADFIVYYALPFTLVGTKADKLAKSKRAAAVSALPKSLGIPACVSIPFSANEEALTLPLLNRIGEILEP